MAKPVLYSYFRSSCSWRVRIALALKGIDYDYKSIHLVKGEQSSDEYKAVNPQGCVPALVIDGLKLWQSITSGYGVEVVKSIDGLQSFYVSIMEYLDETHPKTNPLLPGTPSERATVRRLTQMIASDIQPIQNLRILKLVGDERKSEFGKHVITHGFRALETALKSTAGKYCFGDNVTMVDLCLVPQVYNGNRFGVDMSEFPLISRINASLNELPEFKAAHPSAQPDCPEDLK